MFYLSNKNLLNIVYFKNINLKLNQNNIYIQEYYIYLIETNYTANRYRKEYKTKVYIFISYLIG